MNRAKITPVSFNLAVYVSSNELLLIYKLPLAPHVLLFQKTYLTSCDIYKKKDREKFVNKGMKFVEYSDKPGINPTIHSIDKKNCEREYIILSVFVFIAPSF